MVKHIVMWTIQDAQGRSKEENLKLLKSKLEALPAVIPQIEDYQVGINSMASDAAFDIVLISTFKTWEDLETYKNNPVHVEVADLIANIRDQRAVVDFEV